MSFASASARAGFPSNGMFSRPTPFMTSAKADAEPTMPQPTTPIFILPPSAKAMPTTDRPSPVNQLADAHSLRPYRAKKQNYREARVRRQFVTESAREAAA